MPGQETDGSLRERRITARGAATRDRIVQSAADLMYVKGVNATTLDDVIAASGVSKSQLYWHFPGKEDLTRAVIAQRGQEVLDRENQRLQRLYSYRGLVRWRNALVQANSLQNGAYGCVLGSMANELADQDEQAVMTLAGLFESWEELLAALQGGYLLARTAHNCRPMEIALDLALDHVRSYLTDAGSGA
jgi:TetR/AcrR family transcriptional repressor of nem operon